MLVLRNRPKQFIKYDSAVILIAKV